MSGRATFPLSCNFFELAPSLLNSISVKKVLFTGKMEHKNRKEMEADARKLGAKIQSSVSKKTDFLVCGENGGAKKIKKAQTLGVKIISENEYAAMIKKSKVLGL